MSSERVLVAGIIAFVAAAVLLGGFIAGKEREECEAAGGHIIRKPVTGFGVSSTGQMVTTFDTITFCVDAEGGILW